MIIRMTLKVQDDTTSKPRQFQHPPRQSGNGFDFTSTLLIDRRLDSQ